MTRDAVARPLAPRLTSACSLRRRCVAGVGLLLVLVSGCSSLSLIPSSNAALARNLRKKLRASTGHYSPDRISFELFLGSEREAVSLAGRAITVTANDAPIEAPRDWSLAMRLGVIQHSENYAYDYCALWHMLPSRVTEWLGGPGTYSVRVSIGPAQSNEVVLDCTPEGEVAIVSEGEAPYRLGS
jgi:hypothetical protein